MNLGRVLIAAFMVAIFLGPRRWMAWAGGAARARRVWSGPRCARGA